MQSTIHRRPIFLLLALAAVLLSQGCESLPYAKKERTGEPDIYQVTANDPLMNAAMDSAARTWPAFATALRANDSNFTQLCVKIPYPTIKGTEHVWLSDIRITDGEFSGILSNEPADIPRLHIGDTLRIDTTQISDWIYLDRGRMRGGYTIRVIRDQQSTEEQRKMDAENGWIIE